MTRRVVKPQPVCYGPNITFDPHGDFFLSKEKNWLRCRVCGHDPEYSRSESNIAHHWVPPYRPGEILYVREAWTQDGDVYRYKAGFYDQNRKWHPSIHMPREAARIFLYVKDVHVERLQDITDDGVEKEGVPIFGRTEKEVRCLQAFSRYRKVWNSTIKPADRALYGWQANPWVWVVAFEKVSREEAL